MDAILRCLYAYGIVITIVSKIEKYPYWVFLVGAILIGIGANGW